jgi:DNA mismatch endonuclease (patch repair protein)
VRLKKQTLPHFDAPTKRRSKNMRAIRSGQNESTEQRLRSILRKSKVQGWRTRPAGLLGCPDFFFAEKRLAIFVDGCFWHGCPRCGHIPRRNRSYWMAKISRNKKRDLVVNRKLRRSGISVLRFWECQLQRSPHRCLERIARALSTRVDEVGETNKKAADAKAP